MEKLPKELPQRAIQGCCSNNSWHKNTESQITFSGMNLKLINNSLIESHFFKKGTVLHKYKSGHH